jgi:hypothetical protein
LALVCDQDQVLFGEAVKAIETLRLTFVPRGAFVEDHQVASKN